MTKPFSLSKSERLKSKKEIDTLFLHGKAFFVFPFKVISMLFDDTSEHENLLFGISVPKRNFKRSVDRNRLKRLTRESYRILKPDLRALLIQQKQSMHVMFIYTHKEMISSETMKPGMEEAMKKLSKMLEKKI
jgi:ribonuclease P protein component